MSSAPSPISDGVLQLAIPLGGLPMMAKPGDKTSTGRNESASERY
jgi:hypothetical protein